MNISAERGARVGIPTPAPRRGDGCGCSRPVRKGLSGFRFSPLPCQAMSHPLRLSRPHPRRSCLEPLRNGLTVVVLLAVLTLPLLALGARPVLAAMDYAKQVLIGADFHAVDLRGATFNLTNLRDADFSGADLRLASLFGAKLQDANLSGADLREATLDSAVLKGTDLRGAWLEDAFAFNTRFEDVQIDGADFSHVDLRADARKTLCAVATGRHPQSGRLTRDTLDCP